MASTVFQQVILDKVTAKPGGSGANAITRDDANSGVLVKLSSSQQQRNADAFGSVVVEKTDGDVNEVVYGVLADYHDSRSCTVLRKGKLFMRSQVIGFDSFIGRRITTSVTHGVCGPVGSGSPGWGEILGFGEHEKLGYYYIVDFNGPERKRT